jgi:iron complex outermembrane receptor protein
MKNRLSSRTTTIQKLINTSIFAVIAVTVMMPVTSQAQEPGAALEEILVTATRRAEGTPIQTTPVAVTAITADDIDRMVPRDLLAVAVESPNVVAGKQPGFNSANWAIRGVGQASIILYFESQVGTTVDDFVIPHIQTANLEMLDIDSVEILRGPQGTLFGKNTTGGVINVRTNRPELGQGSLDVRGRVAEFGRTDTQAVLNIPLGEQAAFRAAAMYLKSDGYFKNGAAYGPVVTLCATGTGLPCGAVPDDGVTNIPGITGTSGQGDGSDIGGDDVFSGRFKFRWQPNNDLDLNLTYEIVRDQSDTPVAVNGTPPPNGTLVDYLWNFIGLTADPGDQVDVGAVTNREDNLLQMGSRGHEIDVDGFYLHANWALNDNYDLTGMAGYRETDSWLPSTYTGEVGPVSLFDANRQDNRETTQLELRLASDLAGAFDWVAGAFYQQDDTIFTVAQTLGFLDLIGLGEAFFGDQLFFNNNVQVLSNSQDADSFALFVDGTWAVNEQWTLEGGVRWTNEQKDWTGRNQIFTQALQSSSDPGGCDPFFFGGPTWQELGEPLAAADFSRWDCGVIRDSEEWDEPTWRLAVSYQVNDNVYTYFNYARGFKSGGYNDQAGTSGSLLPIQARPTDPETADSFEIGLRSDLADDTFRFNASAFYVTYDDSIQPLVTAVTRPDGSEFEATRFFNAAEITVFGLELESTWVVSESFRIRGNLGWLDAEFDKFEADTDLDGTIDTDLSGNPVGRAPELTWTVAALYEQDLAGGQLAWAADVNYEDEAVYTYTAVPGTPNGMTDDRTLVNASVTYTSENEQWWIRAYGKNLTDEEYRIGELPVGGLWVMTYWAEPLSFGLEGGLKFDW